MLPGWLHSPSASLLFGSQKQWCRWCVQWAFKHIHRAYQKSPISYQKSPIWYPKKDSLVFGCAHQRTQILSIPRRIWMKRLLIFCNTQYYCCNNNVVNSPESSARGECIWKSSLLLMTSTVLLLQHTVLLLQQQFCWRPRDWCKWWVHSNSLVVVDIHGTASVTKSVIDTTRFVLTLQKLVEVLSITTTVLLTTSTVLVLQRTVSLLQQQLCWRSRD